MDAGGEEGIVGADLPNHRLQINCLGSRHRPNHHNHLFFTSILQNLTSVTIPISITAINPALC